MRIARNIEGRARFIDSCLWNGALREQIFGAREIRLCLGHLRIQAGDLCVQRLHLQHELVVADDANDLTLADVVTLSNRQLCNSSADAGARRYDIS